MQCLFCEIVAGNIPAKKIYEDDLALAFLDINPWQRGHSLVIPKRHVDDLLADPTVLGEVSAAAYATGELLREKLGAQGMNLLSNIGSVAGQEVFHMHLHLIPRFANNPGIAAMRQRETGIDLDQVHDQITK